MSLTKAEEMQFFAHKKGSRTRITMGGKKLALANMPDEVRERVKERLAEKDEVIAQGKLGILPGILIDGKQVTKDNIHEFEISGMKSKEIIKPKEEVKKSEEVEEPEEIIDEIKEKVVDKLTKKELEVMTFKELKVIGKALGTTDRSKSNLIKEILKLQ